MLKVLPIQNKDEQKELCALCHIAFKPDSLAYRCDMDDVFVGMSQFHLTDTYGIIEDFANAEGTSDTESLFVLGRATLNFIDLCGIKSASFEAPFTDIVNEKLIHRIGFKTDDHKRYFVDLTHFFEHPCENK